MTSSYLSLHPAEEERRKKKVLLKMKVLLRSLFSNSFLYFDIFTTVHLKLTHLDNREIPSLKYSRYYIK